MTPADLRALADRRFEAAVREGREQLGKGWKPNEILGVLHDAARPIADLRSQADALDAAIAQEDMLARAERRTSRLRQFRSMRGAR